MLRIAFLWLLFCACAQTQERAVSPVAGPSSRGDGGPATAALLDGPQALAIASNGDAYFTELHNGTIRRVRRDDGVIERAAGNGVRADGAEGRPANATSLLTPTALHFHPVTGELYFADAAACRIRKIPADGTIRNVAGTGRCSGSAGGGFPFPGGGFNRDRLALDTDLGAVSGLAFDSEGRLFFTEENLHQIRRIDADGYIRLIVGAGRSGFAGDGGAATDALLNSPTGIVFDNRGNYYIADSRNCRVRRVDAGNTIETIAGTGNCAVRAANFAGGLPSRTAIGRLSGIAYDATSHLLYVASPQQSRLLRIDLDGGRITSVLGNGTVGLPDFARGPNQFVLSEPSGVAVSSEGAVLAAGVSAYQIYRLHDGAVRPFAGKWPDDSTLLRPVSACTHADGSLLVLDAGTERILRIDAATNEMKAFAGAASPTGYISGDGGPALRAQLANPRRVFCADDGRVFLSHDSLIRVIETTGVIRLVRSSLSEPTGLLLDRDGHLIYADAAAHRVYRYDPGTRSETVLAGTGRSDFAGDAAAAIDAHLNSPGDLAWDAAGNLLIADRSNRRIRRLRLSDGKIETVIGSSREYSYIDITGEAASDVGLDPIRGLAVAGDGTVYVGESSRLTSVDRTGRVTVLLGYAGENDAGVRSQRGREISDLSGLGLSGSGVLAAVGSEGVVLRVE